MFSRVGLGGRTIFDLELVRGFNSQCNLLEFLRNESWVSKAILRPVGTGLKIDCDEVT